MPAIELKLLMQKVATGASLAEDEIKDAFETMMSGVATPVQMAAFLMALRVRGETIPEITGASRLMRERMLPVEAPPDAVDIVGTGGDGHNTYNVSTCAALVAAGAGVPIAKHGNRARVVVVGRLRRADRARRQNRCAAARHLALRSPKPGSASCGRRCTMRR